jgi:hypothetical protein
MVLCSCEEGSEMTRSARLVALAAVLTLIGLTPRVAAAYPTQLYVSKTGNDAGNNCRSSAHPCLTIAHALSQAPPGATINIGPGDFQERLDIRQNVLLSGQGQLKTFIDGTLGGTVVIIEPSYTVTLQSLTVENGLAMGSQGGTAFHASQIKPRCPDAVGTSEPGGDAAGGIYNAGTLSVVASGVTNNTATGGTGGTAGAATGANGICGANGDNGTGGDANGGNAAGGIFNTGTLSVNGGTITGNTATGGNGGAGGAGTGGDSGSGNGGDGFGGWAPGGNAAGGIYNDVSGTVRLTRVTFGGNTGNGGPGGAGGNGAGGSSTTGNGGSGTGGAANGGFAAGGLLNDGVNSSAVFALLSTLKGDTGNGGLGGTAGNAFGGNGNNYGGGALTLFANGGDGAGEDLNLAGDQRWSLSSFLNGTGHGGDGGIGGTAIGGNGNPTTGNGENAVAEPGSGGAGVGGLGNVGSGKFVVTLIATFVQSNTGAGGSAGTAGTAIAGTGGASNGSATMPAAMTGDSAGGILAYAPVTVVPSTLVRNNTPNNCWRPNSVPGCS